MQALCWLLIMPRYTGIVDIYGCEPEEVVEVGNSVEQFPENHNENRMDAVERVFDYGPAPPALRVSCARRARRVHASVLSQRWRVILGSRVVHISVAVQGHV